VLSCWGVAAQATKVAISIRRKKKWIKIFFFFIVVTPFYKFAVEMICCETFSNELIVGLGKIFLDLLTTSLPDTSPSPTRV